MDSDPLFTHCKERDEDRELPYTYLHTGGSLSTGSRQCCWHWVQSANKRARFYTAYIHHTRAPDQIPARQQPAGSQGVNLGALKHFSCR